MVDDQDYDWDYYEFGAEEQKNKEKMQGIAKFDGMTVYKHSSNNDSKYNNFQIQPVMKDLEETYGLIAKDSDLLKTGKNLKQKDKTPTQIQNLGNAQVPVEGQGKVISQNDDQRQKTGGNIVSFPQTSIGLVLVTYKDGTVLRGSGSFVGPNHVITCANILYRRNQKGQANQIASIVFYPGLCINVIVYESIQVIKALVLPNYIKNLEPENNDIGILIIDKPLGLQCGWFGLLNLPDETISYEKIEVSGYPQDKENNGYIQYSSKGKADSLTTDTLEYKLDTSLGQNGGPVFLEKIVNAQITDYYLLGVHIGFNPKRMKNYAIRITHEKFEQLKQIIEFHFLQESMDDAYFTQQIKDQKIVTMNFENTYASTLNIQNYFFVLRSNTGLQEINLKVRNVQNQIIITNEVLVELSDSLKQLINLKSLKLDMFNCDNINDETVKNLSNSLAFAKELQHLWITFNYNSKITSSGLKDLTNCLHTLINIESFTFFIYNLTQIQDDGLKYLANNISKLPNLTSLKLDIQKSVKCTEKGFKDMCNSLAQIKTLDRLNLILLGMKMTDQLKPQLKELFKNINSVSII